MIQLHLSWVFCSWWKSPANFLTIHTIYCNEFDSKRSARNEKITWKKTDDSTNIQLASESTKQKDFQEREK